MDLNRYYFTTIVWFHKFAVNYLDIKSESRITHPSTLTCTSLLYIGNLKR